MKKPRVAGLSDGEHTSQWEMYPQIARIGGATLRKRLPRAVRTSFQSNS